MAAQVAGAKPATLWGSVAAQVAVMEVVARKEEVAVRRVAVVHLAAEVAPLEVTAGMVVTSPAAAKRAQEGVEGRPDSACCPSRVLPAAQQAQTD